MPNNFVHLHTHTQYSLLDGAIRIPDLIKQAEKFEMPAVAITDHGTMYGAIEFYKEAKKGKGNVKPIIGCEVYVAPTKLNIKNVKEKKAYHLVLLAKNITGYKNLCKMVTIANIEGFYYKPRVDKDLLKEYSEGIVALSACLAGEIPNHILNGNFKKAKETIKEYATIFGEDNFFLEIQDNDLEDQEKVNSFLIEASKEESLGLVLTNDCHYLKKEDSFAHEVLLCIQTASKINDKKRFKFNTEELYFKSFDNINDSFKELPGAISNTLHIANMCNVEFDFETYHFPQYSADTSLDIDAEFEKKVEEGFKKRIEILKDKDNFSLEKYEERLKYEIKVIKEMGFCGYFLIVADFIGYAKNNKIPVGPGRGSAAGSLVAYSLNITELDPLEYGLFFERFLNPGRKSMPDIDVDFCIRNRSRVLEYVIEKYGFGKKDKDAFVAQIGTFGTLKEKNTIRDVGRALDVPLSEIDRIAKLVPYGSKSIEDAIKNVPELQKAEEENEEIRKVLEISKKLEGLSRHSGTHAAGVVISDKKLTEYMPLYMGGKNKDVITTQYDMHCVENLGLIKFDFLGLKNLTIIDDCKLLLKERKKEVPDFTKIDLNDEKTYKLLQAGNTLGVFQLESDGMRSLLTKAKPQKFDEIIAIISLYRPGPLEAKITDAFVARKLGKEKTTYLIPELESILKDTYGFIIYQEQVMQIAAKVANYSMQESDDLRKAMGKKKESLMNENKNVFISRAIENGIAKEKATKLFNDIKEFAGYGFNKSHGAAYALISFQTAYLKAHYPKEFMAALLTNEMDNTDNIIKHITNCREQGIDVLPPSINESSDKFIVVGDSIRFGLSAIKNVGEMAAKIIVKERKKKKFTSIFDFCKRISSQTKVNKRVIEALIKSGAFDCTKNKRSQLIEVVEKAIKYGNKAQKKSERNVTQPALFELPEEEKAKEIPELPGIEEYENKLLLQFEKESLGFYITGHPMLKHRHIELKFADTTTKDLKERYEDSKVKICGYIKNFKEIETKEKKDKMAFVTMEDMYGTFETVVFPKVYKKAKKNIKEDNVIFIIGNVQKRQNSTQIIANELYPIKSINTLLSKVVIVIKEQKARDDKAFLQKLLTILKKHKGGCNITICVKLISDDIVKVKTGDEFKINPTEEFCKEIETFLEDNQAIKFILKSK